MSWYNARYTYCSLRGDRGGDLEHDLPSWEATVQLLKLIKKPKTTQLIIDLIFKVTTEWFDMTRFPGRDGGPWDKAIRMQDLAIALHQGYVAGKDSIKVVLEASKRAIPKAIATLQSHETRMRNFLDLIERAPFSKEECAHDKHLKARMEFVQKLGSERLFPYPTTTSIAIKRERGDESSSERKEDERYNT